MKCGRCYLQELSFVIGVGLSWLHLASAYTKTYTMSEHCGDLIDMEYKHLTSVNVQLTDLSIYSPHMSCSFGVRAPTDHRLTLVVEWMDIAVGRFSSCSDYLSVWDGDFRNKTDYVQGMAPKQCGNEAPPSVTSRDRALIIHFDSNTLEHGAGFFLVFSAFHEGECRMEEFTCDNGRCIDKRLNCDDYDNCGDNSDNCILSVGEVVVAVVVTSLIFVLIVSIAIIYCHRDKLKGRKKCPIIGANPDGVYQPTTEPVTASTSQATTAV